MATLKEKIVEEKAWEMWISIYPDMVVPRNKVHRDNKVHFEPLLKHVPFHEYLERIRKPKVISKRPAKDILAEAEEIQKQILDKKRGE
ncbi:hypothetical protein MO973_19840 [Paenibacillus sp. TRM 82003]|nr:hypothetical protein [Paenibacillus sp. TRM 82003]